MTHAKYVQRNNLKDQIIRDKNGVLTGRRFAKKNEKVNFYSLSKIEPIFFY